MLHLRFLVSVGISLAFAGGEAYASNGSFPAVPPPSKNIAPASTEFPSVPPPSQGINGHAPAVTPSQPAAFPVTPPASPAATDNLQYPPAPGASHAPQAPTAPIDLSRQPTVRLRRLKPPKEPSMRSPSKLVEQDTGAPAKPGTNVNGSDEANRKREAEIKAGTAPARAYATPTKVEVPKAFQGKQAELDELLKKYMANEITPDEYHKKRAEIIARP